MRVFVCLAKSGKTGLLCPTTLGRDTLRNRQSCRCWGEKRNERMTSVATGGASSPLTWCPVAGASGRPYIQRWQHLRRGVWSWRRRRGRGGGGEEKTSCRDHCAEGLRGAGRGFELAGIMLHPSVPLLPHHGSSAPDWWRDSQPLPAWTCYVIT